MKKYINDFLLYIQFFTRIPVNLQLDCSNENFRRGAMFFPIIGFIVGGIQYLVYLLLNKYLPSSITAIFVVLTFVLLTGALHLDGLGDVCDGFFAFKGGKEKIIDIMKDSTIGVYSCVAIVLDLLFKYNLIKLAIDSYVPQIIIVAPIIARFSVVLLATIGKNAKSTGTGNIFIGNIQTINIVVTAVICLLLQFIFISYKDMAILTFTAIIITLLFNKFCEHKINGLTGDTLGAINELVEILTLTIFFII